MKSVLTLTALACATLSLAACNAETPEQAAAPQTAASMPEGQNEATGAIEPGMGAVANEGGGIPGASTGNPAAAPAVSSPPDTGSEAQQTPK